MNAFHNSFVSYDPCLSFNRICSNLMAFLQINVPQYCSAEIDRPAGPAVQLRVELLFHNCFEWESLVNLLRHADISVTITSLGKTLRGLVELMKPAIVKRLHDLWPRQNGIKPTIPEAPYIYSQSDIDCENPPKINTVGQISTSGNEI